MNERIRELNMQAAEYATSVCPTHSRDWYPIQNTKFAELIVRECMEQVRDEVQYEYDWKLADAVTKRVMEHFGVEE